MHVNCRTSELGTEYMGTISVTVSGKTCQAWTADSPHVPDTSLSSSQFPDASMAEASNYCRNVGSAPDEFPWCYTTDPDERWEFCDVPLCDGEWL